MDAQASQTSTVLVAIFTIVIGIVSVWLLWTSACGPTFQGDVSTGKADISGSEFAAPQQGRAVVNKGEYSSSKQTSPMSPPSPSPAPIKRRPGSEPPARTRQGSATEMLLPYFRGTGTDDIGRRLAEVRAWDFDRMEMAHDYVQWMFPTDEMSAFNPGSPILVPEIQLEFQRDPDLRRELALNFERFCQFLGLEMQRTATEVLVTIGPNFEDRRRDCWQPMGFMGNHNWLRVSRVLHCLGLCSMPQEQRALMACLEDMFAKGLCSCGQSIPHWRKRAGTLPHDSCD